MQNTTERKKIALVIYSLGVGGAEKVLADLSLQFSKQHDVTFIVLDDYAVCYPYGGRLINLNQPSVEGAASKLVNILRRTWKLRKLFRRERFDHIISFMEHASFPALMAAPIGQVIASNHCNPNKLNRMDWVFLNRLYPRSKKVVAVSKVGANVFRQRAQLSNVDYLHNPINLALIAEKKSQSAEFLPQKPFIVAVGRLNEAKNFHSLIRAFHLSGLKNQYHLLILGEGGERDSLETLVKQLNMEAHIRLPGFVANPYPYFHHAQCMVLSSRHEGFPVVIAEALACGCPVIATRCETGPDEIITHGENGLLVPVDDDQALADAMQYLLQDEVMRQSISQHAPQTVQHLDLPEVAQKWLQF